MARTSARTSPRCCGSTSTTRTRVQSARSPRTTPSWIKRVPNRRFTPTGCGTRGGWRSTARRAFCGWRTSAKTCSRRSTWSSRGATTAGKCAGGCTRSAPKGRGCGPACVDPIWEYSHDIGKAITGGHVYHGERLPELEGHYLYADYVSGRIWALRYGEKEKRVVANHPIKDRSLPIMSFGEDERGEAYLLT